MPVTGMYGRVRPAVQFVLNGVGAFQPQLVLERDTNAGLLNSQYRALRFRKRYIHVVAVGAFKPE